MENAVFRPTPQPESLEIVLLGPDGGPPGMEGVIIPESWAFQRFSDEADMTWEQLWEGIEQATTPSDRTIHVEIDRYDWGASGPWQIIYEVAISCGFEAAAAALAAWLTSTFGPTAGVLEDVSDATRIALRHLRKYHKVSDPVLEESRSSDIAWHLGFRDGHRRYRVEVRGKDALILRIEMVQDHDE